MLELLAGSEIEEKYNKGVYPNIDEVARLLDVDLEEVKISLHTLDRYGCLITRWSSGWMGTSDGGIQGFRVNHPKSNFRLSHLGMQLVQATRTT